MPPQPAGLYGMAAELTQQGMLAQPLALATSSQPQPGPSVQGSQFPPLRSRASAAPSSTLTQQDARTQPAFGLGAELQGQAAGAAPGGSDQYGLVLELTQGQGGPNPLITRPDAQQGSSRVEDGPLAAALRRQQRATARRGLASQLDQAAASGTQFPPAAAVAQPQDTQGFTVLSAPEPDYGLVAELKGQGLPPQPYTQRADFGLAAEVARRRARPDAPLPPIR